MRVGQEEFAPPPSPCTLFPFLCVLLMDLRCTGMCTEVAGDTHGELSLEEGAAPLKDIPYVFPGDINMHSVYAQEHSCQSHLARQCHHVMF